MKQHRKRKLFRKLRRMLRKALRKFSKWYGKTMMYFKTEYTSPTDEYGKYKLSITPKGCVVSCTKTYFFDAKKFYETDSYILVKKHFTANFRCDHHTISYIILDKKGIILGIVDINFTKEYYPIYEGIIDKNFKKALFLLDELIYPDQMERVVDTLRHLISKDEPDMPIYYGWGVAASMEDWPDREK